MKKNKKIKCLLIGIVLFGAMFLMRNMVLSYHTGNTHPKITQKAIELYNQYYPKQQITKEQAKLIGQGAVKEDNNGRYLHHFYDPNTKKGILGNSNAKEWANGASDNEDESWLRAISEYQNGDADEALVILGQILHLLEDMSVPAHTRIDAHNPDPYEQWAEDYLAKKEINFSLGAPVYYSSLDKYFDDIAGYSSKYFISKNANEKKLPSLSVRDGYSYTNDSNNSEIKVSRVEIKNNEYKYYVHCNDNQSLCDSIHQSYYEHLVPYAIPRLAGAIKLFFDKSGGAKVEKPLTILEKTWDAASTFAVNTWNKTTDAAASAWNTTSAFAVNTLNQTVVLTTSFANNAYSSIKNILKNPQSQQTGLTNILSQNTANNFPQNSNAAAESNKEEQNIAAAIEIPKEIKKVYSAQLYAQSLISTLEPQQGATISVQFRNTGNVIWNKKDISLNVASADASKFHHASWLTGLRPTLQDQQQVKPSELAGFTFPIQSPAAEGEYNLSFKLVYQDAAGFHNLGNSFVNWLVKVKNKLVELVSAQVSPIAAPYFEPIVQNIPPPPAPVSNPIALPPLSAPQIIANFNIPLGFDFFPCNGEIAEEEYIDEELPEPEEFIPLEAPKITTHNGENFAANAAEIIIEGTKEERITNIYINSSTENIVYADAESWAKTFTLEEGENIFVAQGADGSGNLSATSSISIIYDSIAPDVSLTISNASLFSNTLTLNALSGDIDIDYYNFEFQINTTTEDWNLYHTLTMAAATSTSVNFTGQADDAIYYFRIKAVDEAGNESYSDIASAEISTHPIVFNEIGWMGTEAEGNDEWIELYNKSGQEINLADWSIEFDGNSGLVLEQKEFCLMPAMPVKLAIMIPNCFELSIPAHGYFLIERTGDNTIKNIAANWYGAFSNGGLKDNGIKITLKNTAGDVMDELDCGEGWFAGDKGQGEDTKKAMERISVFADANNADNWANNNEMIINGIDKKEGIILGTPQAKNSVSY